MIGEIRERERANERGRACGEDLLEAIKWSLDSRNENNEKKFTTRRARSARKTKNLVKL